MSALPRKKSVRAGHRGSATKMTKEVEDLLAQPVLDTEKLSRLRLTLQEKLGVLKQLDAEVLDMVDEGEVADEIVQSDEFNEKVYAALVKIERVLAPCPTPVSTASTASRVHSSVDTSHTPSRVKLPKLTIPPFSGDLTEWTPFWESYKTAIHDNRDLAAIEKFNYLRSLLQRAALDAISGLSLSEANYGEAVSILMKRFGNKQQIVAKHMDALLNVEAVSSQNNLKGLRKLYDLIETHIRSLKALGVGSESYGGILVSVLLHKLPPELQLYVSREVGEDQWKLDEMMKVIGKEIEARERMAPASVLPTKRPTKESPTAAALLTGQAHNPNCTYCKQAHTSNSCRVVTEPKARKEVLMKAGRCFVCLRRNHISRECRSNMRCSKCKGRHHVSICPGTAADPTSGQVDPNVAKPDLPRGSTFQAQSTVEPPREPSAQQRSRLNAEAPAFPPSNNRSTSLWVNSDRAILLQTARAVVFNPDAPQHSRSVRLVLDCGSQRSYITEDVSRELRLVSRETQSLTILTFGSNKAHSHPSDSVRLGLTLKSGKSIELNLFTVPLICESVSCQPVSFCQETFEHLQGIDLADPTNGHSCLDIDMLIGSDLYWELVTGQVRRGSAGPVAIRTKLGWVLSGTTSSSGASTTSACLVTHTLRVDGRPQESQSLDDRLKTFWELESFGISSTESSVYDEFKNSIKFVDGKYEVKLPWREGHPVLPDNYGLCLKRLNGLIKRLRQNPDILNEYNATIQDQLKRGIVEAVVTSGRNAERVHYLPHHAVVRYNKETTKVRVVYDASAHSDGPSLNDCLHAGPKFSQFILDILLRFRVHRVAIMADIEKAFLMVSVAQEDRDALRFLWVKDAFGDQLDIMELRFTRVVFGVSSSPFLLNATIQHHLEQYGNLYPKLVTKLGRSIYVDDVVTGADDEEQAFQMFMQSKSILKDGGFNLRKFCSNSASLQARVDSSIGLSQQTGFVETAEETYANSTLHPDNSPHPGEQRVLGVQWEVSSDRIVISLEGIVSVAQTLIPTKRNIVSLVGRFYDPIGILAPVVILFKIFFQEICEAKLDWDQQLNEALLGRWRKLKACLQEGLLVSIPRCYFDGVTEPLVSCMLCGFCDASLRAYAGVVYLLVETSGGSYVRFIASKTRVSPLQTQSVPRLELLSALLLARLLVTITRCLEGEIELLPARCYADSTVAISWIRGVNKTWKPFVQNRVHEIRRLTSVDSWRHCSGRENPADIPSRGLTPSELSLNVLWRDGPDWLLDQNTSSDPPEAELPEECLAELRVKDQQTVLEILVGDEFPRLSKIIKCEEFSSLNRLLTTTAIVLRFCRILVCKVRPNTTFNALSLRDDAERFWILDNQRVMVANSNFKQLQKQFDLFQDETGVWRCRGRIQNAAISYSTKHPVLIYRNHHLAILLVRNAHSRVLHNGVKETLTELRSRFWLVKGRSFVKGIIHQCRICRRHEGKSYKPPNPPPLPSFRVEEAPPFTFCGVDFAGPLYVKSSKGSDKVWICLYTCCVVRAVHLDLVPDLSTSSFLRSFRRFTARRGLPSQVISDNGKTFKAAAKSICDVKWRFNVPKAPWWGGFFERLVGCTKRCLRKIIGQAKLTYDELLTALTEVEMVLNSRPLSYVSTEDIEEPLTPSHLLIGRRLMNVPEICNQEPDAFNINSDDMSRRAKYLNNTVNRFWERWRKEYLVNLREAHCLRRRNSQAPRLSVGDVVIIHSDEQPRGLWSLGRVEQLLIGPDKECRAALVRVAGSGRSAKCLQRPVQRLYPLEMHSPENDAESTTECSDPSPSDATDPSPSDATSESSPLAPTPLRRSRRAAAIVAKDRLVAQAFDRDENS